MRRQVNILPRSRDAHQANHANTHTLSWAVMVMPWPQTCATLSLLSPQWFLDHVKFVTTAHTVGTAVTEELMAALDAVEEQSGPLTPDNKGALQALVKRVTVSIWSCIAPVLDDWIPLPLLAII